MEQCRLSQVKRKLINERIGSKKAPRILGCTPKKLQWDYSKKQQKSDHASASSLTTTAKNLTCKKKLQFIGMSWNRLKFFK